MQTSAVKSLPTAAIFDKIFYKAEFLFSSILYNFFTLVLLNLFISFDIRNDSCFND